MRRSGKGAVRIGHAVMILLSLMCIIPFWVVVSVSLTSESAIFRYGYRLIPAKFSLEAYEFLFQNPNSIFRSYAVTLFITGFGTFFGTLIMAMTAYPISRSDFRYKTALSFYIYFTMLFSGGMVPTYLLVAKYLSLKDTVWALILPIMLSAWNVFLLRIFFASIPASLIEAASIEGASECSIFFTMIIPLGKVGIATVGFFTAMGFWNDWFQSMLYIDHDQIISLQYLLYRAMNRVELAKEYSGNMVTSEKLPNENLRMALCVVAAGPMILAFPFCQKYFSKGIVVGSVKG